MSFSFMNTPAVMPGPESGPPTFHMWSAPGRNYTFNSPLAPPPININARGDIEPEGASWVSNIPVMANGRALKTPYTQFLNASDPIWVLRPSRARDDIAQQTAQRLNVFNLPAVNNYLVEECQKADEWVAQQLSNVRGSVIAPRLANLATCGDYEFEEALEDADLLGQRPESTRGLLAFRTSNGVATRFSYLGVNMTQPNMITSVDPNEGSLSAEQDDTQVAWVTRGPAEVVNLWGPGAMGARHLHVLVKPVSKVLNPRQPDNVTRVFQLVPYMSADLSDVVPPGDDIYINRAGLPEHCARYYVGMVALRGTVMTIDTSFRQMAAGSDPSKAFTAHQHLERINVTVQPQRHGSFIAQVLY